MQIWQVLKEMTRLVHDVLQGSVITKCAAAKRRHMLSIELVSQTRTNVHINMYAEAHSFAEQQAQLRPSDIRAGRECLLVCKSLLSSYSSPWVVLHRLKAICINDWKLLLLLLMIACRLLCSLGSINGRILCRAWLH